MTEIAQSPKPKFDAWAIVEVMGHIRSAGKVTEEVIAGVNMLRVDVPPTMKRQWQSGEYVGVAMPGYTRYFGGSAIFSITPCSEEIAKASASENSSEPPIALAMLNAPASADFGNDPALVDSDDVDKDLDLERAAGEGMFEHERD